MAQRRLLLIGTLRTQIIKNYPRNPKDNYDQHISNLVEVSLQETQRLGHFNALKIKNYVGKTCDNYTEGSQRLKLQLYHSIPDEKWSK